MVQLAHAGLLPLEQQSAVQQAFSQLAPMLGTSVDTLTALVDKSLPTMIGLGGGNATLVQVSMFADHCYTDCYSNSQGSQHAKIGLGGGNATLMQSSMLADHCYLDLLPGMSS